MKQQTFWEKFPTLALNIGDNTVSIGEPIHFEPAVFEKYKKDKNYGLKRTIKTAF